MNSCELSRVYFCSGTKGTAIELGVFHGCESDQSELFLSVCRRFVRRQTRETQYRPQRDSPRLRRRNRRCCGRIRQFVTQKDPKTLSNLSKSPHSEKLFPNQDLCSVSGRLADPRDTSHGAGTTPSSRLRRDGLAPLRVAKRKPVNVFTQRALRLTTSL